MPPDRAAVNDSLSPDRWARVRTLVEETIMLPLKDRSAFLERSCGGDDDLRGRVERLVAACDRADEGWRFLSQPAGELAAPLLAAAHAPPGMIDQAARLTASLADRYRIERELGAGGMATVYLATDVRHGRQVAIKVLHPELSLLVGRERFLAEIRTSAALQHPHILPLFDSGSAGGLLFFVMPLVDGETLRERITRERQLPVADAVRIASDVAGALDYAHRHGVIHRDIKPENILLHEGRPVIADFGIALAVRAAGGPRTTGPGLSLGTPHYMSPEQKTGGQEITPRSDVYSLGVVTYEMLAGEVPFTGATAHHAVAAVGREPHSLLMRRRQVPASVEAAVLTALEKLPADRFESAAAFARALQDPAFRGSTAHRFSEVRLQVGRRPYLLAVAGVVACALLMVTGWGWWQTRDPLRPVVRFTVDLPRDLTLLSTAATGNLAVSPDGRVVVFSGNGIDGTRRLYSRGLNEITVRVIAGTEGASEPFFSPDGSWLGFWSGGRLLKVAAQGGLPQTLTAMHRFTGATWPRPDVIVFSADGVLYSIPSDGGPPDLLGGLDRATGEEQRLYPVAMRDGDHVLYSSVGRTGTTIGLVSLSQRSGRSLGVAGTNALGVVEGHVIYATRDNALMAISVDVPTGRVGVPLPVAREVSVGVVGSAKAALSLSGTLVYRAGGQPSRMILTDGKNEPQVVMSEIRVYGFPRFSPDGSQIAMTIDEGTRSDVWVRDLASRTNSRISSGGTANERPEWTPDGTRVLFRTDEGNGSSIWWRPVSLSAVAVPLLSGGPPFHFEGVMTPDGKEVVYQADNNIHVRAVTGRSLPRIVAATYHIENQARVSPDGQWVAFVSDESGSDQVVVQPMHGPGARVQVSSNGGTEPVWSRDGRSLFFRANNCFMVASVTTNSRFTVSSRAVYLEDRYVPAAAPHANYDVSPDGTRLLVLEAMDQARIHVVHNWSTEVRSMIQKVARSRNLRPPDRP